MDIETKKTLPVLFSYEKTRILSARISQLERGASTTVTKEDLGPNTLFISKEIARKELELDIIPIKIKRTLPNGDVEYWSTNEFDIK